MASSLFNIYFQFKLFLTLSFYFFSRSSLFCFYYIRIFSTALRNWSFSVSTSAIILWSSKNDFLGVKFLILLTNSCSYLSPSFLNLKWTYIIIKFTGISKFFAFLTLDWFTSLLQVLNFSKPFLADSCNYFIYSFLYTIFLIVWVYASVI